jgi:hypothetical protein
VSPRDWYSRGLVSVVQIVLFLRTTDEQYIAERGWESAVLDVCPFHPAGGCGVCGHGSYARVRPAGVRVARFLCTAAGQTISLLPAFLASRMTGTLEEIERVIDIVESSPSIVAASEVARPDDDDDAVTSISAARWVRRRVRPIRAALVALITLLPDELGECAPTLHAIRMRLGVEHALVALRAIAIDHLRALSPPLGLCARGRR